MDAYSVGVVEPNQDANKAKVEKDVTVLPVQQPTGGYQDAPKVINIELTNYVKKPSMKELIQARGDWVSTPDPEDEVTLKKVRRGAAKSLSKTQQKQLAKSLSPVGRAWQTLSIGFTVAGLVTSTAVAVMRSGDNEVRLYTFLLVPCLLLLLTLSVLIVGDCRPLGQCRFPGGWMWSHHIRSLHERREAFPIWRYPAPDWGRFRMGDYSCSEEGVLW